MDGRFEVLLGILCKRDKRVFRREEVGVPPVGVDRCTSFIYFYLSDRIHRSAVPFCIGLKRRQAEPPQQR
jgi:hypothetical protein